MSRIATRLAAVIVAVSLTAVVAAPTPAAPGAGPTAFTPTSVAGIARQEAGYRWPLDHQPRVTRAFDPPAHRWLPGHRGVDLAAGPLVVVRSAGAGVVWFAGAVAGTGVVSVEHPAGLRTTYQPLTATVQAGDRVAAGDPIGLLEPGHTGCPVLACLHWGLRSGDFYLDPLSLLGLGQIRLLPRDARP